MSRQCSTKEEDNEGVSVVCMYAPGVQTVNKRSKIVSFMGTSQQRTGSYFITYPVIVVCSVWLYLIWLFSNWKILSNGEEELRSRKITLKVVSSPSSEISSRCLLSQRRVEYFPDRPRKHFSKSESPINTCLSCFQTG